MLDYEPQTAEDIEANEQFNRQAEAFVKTTPQRRPKVKADRVQKHYLTQKKEKRFGQASQASQDGSSPEIIRKKSA